MVRRETTQKRRALPRPFFSKIAAARHTAESELPCMPQFAHYPVVNAVAPGRDNRPLASEIGRFTLVGIMNTAVDLGVLNTLIAISHRGRAGLVYSFFKAIAFLVAVINATS